MTEWINSLIAVPKKENLYLCCGDEIQYNMKANDPPDTYFLAYWNGNSWVERVRPYEEVTIAFWMPLPELPKNE